MKRVTRNLLLIHALFSIFSINALNISAEEVDEILSEPTSINGTGKTARGEKYNDDAAKYENTFKSNYQNPNPDLRELNSILKINDPNWGALDITPYEANGFIRFYAKADKNTTLSLKCYGTYLAELFTTAPYGKRIEQAVTNEWQEFTVPLNSFRHSSWKHFKPYVWVFEASSHEDGTSFEDYIYIADFKIYKGEAMKTENEAKATPPSPKATGKREVIKYTLEPSTKPNAAQQTLIDDKYAMFVHLGMNTFEGTEYSYGDSKPGLYKPTAIDAMQWAKVAHDAGMKKIVITSKHIGGFCLWDSAHTDYDVGNPTSGSHIDVIRELSKACQFYGLKLGIYYALWDNHWYLNHQPQNKDIRKNEILPATPEQDKEYIDYVVNQLTELLDGRYGPVAEVWLDGLWVKPEAKRWEIPRIYNHIKTLQPTCQVGVNWCVGTNEQTASWLLPKDQKLNDPMTYFPSDFRLADPHLPAPNDPKLFTRKGKTYYLPFESTICLNSFWFYNKHSYEKQPSKRPYEIKYFYDYLTANQNTLMMNAAPNFDGKIIQQDVDALYGAARLLKIATGDALKGDTDVIENNLALGKTVTATDSLDDNPDLAKMFSAQRAVDGQTITRWATKYGSKASSFEIDFVEKTKINILEIDENKLYPSIKSVKIEILTNGSWETIEQSVPIKEAYLLYSFKEIKTGTKLKLTFDTDNHPATERGAQINEIRVSYFKFKSAR